MTKVYLALVHGPVMNKRGMEVTTSVTNLDIHDIARSCKTFGIEKYFLVTPVEAQFELINKITGHWKKDEANEYNPDRQDAFTVVQHVKSIEAAEKFVEEAEGIKATVVVTGANFKDYEGNADVLREKMQVDKSPILLLFGTGWGLTASIVERADFRLTPIFGSASDGYNHLSVRSAVAIYLDRIQSNR